MAVRARGRGGPRAGAGSGAHPARRFPQGGRGFGLVALELQPLQRRRRQHFKASRTAPHGLRGARGGMGTEAAHHRGARATSLLHPLRQQPAAIRAPRRPNLPEQMPGPARTGGAGRQFGVCRVVAGQPENAPARQFGAAGGRAARCAARGCCGGGGSFGACPSDAAAALPRPSADQRWRLLALHSVLRQGPPLQGGRMAHGML